MENRPRDETQTETTAQSMRLGVFGGSFDPIHFGHLLLAEQCRETLALDVVWFVPARRPPHKPSRELAADEHRYQMAHLATAGHPGFSVSRVELEREGTSYTVDTLESIARDHPNATRFFLMGADSVRDFPTWRDPERICQLALPAVVHRGGMPPPDLALLQPFLPDHFTTSVERLLVPMPHIELSSSDIRGRVARGRSIRYQTPAAVAEYITAQKLYQDDSS